jgi:hypothetical protein
MEAAAQQEPAREVKVSQLFGRWATLNGVENAAGAAVTYSEGLSYDSVQLGCDAKSVERNSVLLVPNLLTAAECDLLIQDVELNGIEGVKNGGGGFERHRISQLSPSTIALFEKVLRERLLPLVTAELPAVEDYIWACSTRPESDLTLGMTPTQPRSARIPLGLLPYRFTPNEPAINRYSDGAEFGAHTDQQALTLNILLRASGAESFEGGGTAFWREGVPRRSADDLPTMWLQPAAGVGVVFNGQVKHAGRPVTAGVRHLLVASFSITNPSYASRKAEQDDRLPRAT